MLNLTKKINLTKKLLTIAEMLSMLKIQNLTKKLKIQPFAYKLVRQMNEELEAKGFITIAGRVSRKYYEEKFYGMAQAN